MSGVVYLLRHGETEWNAEGRIQGALDSPLTDKGIGQARAIGAILRRCLEGAASPLWCSPLGRARQTMAIVCASAGLDPAACRFDDRLRELSWGDWDGMTRAEIEARVPGAMAARLADHWRHRPPGGGSYAELAERLRPFLAEISRTGGIVRLDEPQDAVFRLAPGGAMGTLLS